MSICFHYFLFKVSYENLIEAFTSRSTFARGEMIFSPVSAVKAVDIRDAFVKGIYGRIFIWIVNKINAAIFTHKVCILCIHVNKMTVQCTVHTVLSALQFTLVTRWYKWPNRPSLCSV